MTPLHIACERGSLQLVLCLIEAGCRKDAAAHDWVLFVCQRGSLELVPCETGDLHVVKYLVDCCLHTTHGGGDAGGHIELLDPRTARDDILCLDLFD